MELRAFWDIDKVFKALADPGRRRLLDLLHRENGQTLTALCEHMDMTRQAVTQHLQLLQDANLVAIVWHGREKLHYLNPVPLFAIYERWIEKFERNRLGVLRDLKRTLENDDDDKAYLRVRDLHRHHAGKSVAGVGRHRCGAAAFGWVDVSCAC